MNTAEYVLQKINRLPKGYVFTYKDFVTDFNSEEAIIKSLNRLTAQERIAKLSKGKYYKPETSPFGELPPDQYQVVKDLLEKNGEIIGYITGLGIYNKLGLTTQISNVIQIGRNEIRPALTRGKYNIKFVKQKNTITEGNIPLLQVLDALKYIKSIPDKSIDELCNTLIEIIKNKSENEREKMIKLAIKYPPSTRALLGAIFEKIEYEADVLKKTLNPITVYKYNISKQVLETKKNWNIQ